MTRISRLLATLTGVALLCLAHFASVAHAGITNITVDITVTTTPTPTVQPTVSGAFSYGISCTTPQRPCLLMVTARSEWNDNGCDTDTRTTGRQRLGQSGQHADDAEYMYGHATNATECSSRLSLSVRQRPSY
jgi:hypothetical protein